MNHTTSSTAKQAGQQSAVASTGRPAVACQYVLVELVMLPGYVGREAIPDQNPPAFLNRAVATQIALPTPGESPRIDRIRQNIVHRTAARSDPDQPAPLRPGTRAQRKPLPVCRQSTHRGAHAANAHKRIEHPTHARLHALVGVQRYSACAVTYIASRKGELQFAARRLRFTACMHPLTHGVQHPPRPRLPSLPSRRSRAPAHRQSCTSGRHLDGHATSLISRPRHRRPHPMADGSAPGAARSLSAASTTPSRQRSGRFRT